VENGHAPLRPQPPELLLEGLRIMEALLHPGLKQILPEGVSQVPFEATAEALHP
jgi:hypothetical protein